MWHCLAMCVVKCKSCNVCLERCVLNEVCAKACVLIEEVCVLKGVLTFVICNN